MSKWHIHTWKYQGADVELSKGSFNLLIEDMIMMNPVIFTKSITTQLGIFFLGKKKKRNKRKRRCS